MPGVAISGLHHAIEVAGRLGGLAVQGLTELVWPPVCAICGDSVRTSEDRLCRKCWNQFLSSTAGDYCPHCGRDASRYGLVAGACAACRESEVHFDGIARVGVYTEALQQTILAFKHDRTELISLLAPMVNAALQGSSFSNEIDLLVPVPLHWTRRLVRGYNQSHMIAKRLHHPRAWVCTDLVRVRRTKAQPVVATPAARARNVADAFAVRADHRFAGKVICLIDDIKTTGATLNECARTLKEAGATRVYALVLAVAGQKPA